MKHIKQHNLAALMTPFLLIWVIMGCQELTVENENEPAVLQELRTPAVLEAAGAATFAKNWERQWCGESMMLQTMADANSSAWPNWGMRAMSSEPRIAWNNDPGYNWRASVERPWFGSYNVISSANDILRTLNAPETESQFEAAGIDLARLKAFTKFNQAWAYSLLALMFDRAFIVDESVDLEAVANGDVMLDLQPYSEVMNAALLQMDEAIAIAQANSFAIFKEEDWVFGLDITSETLVQLANSFKAQWMAQLARSPEERNNADWHAIINLIDAGITSDFAPIGDDNGEDREWDCMKFYFSNGTVWSRIDYRTLGPADESGAYATWLAAPLQTRRVFDVITSDRRIVGGDGSNPFIDGKYTQYQGTNGPFPAVHGSYHFSSHNHRRWQGYSDANANGPMHYMVLAEMDLLKAEALLRTGGDVQQVVELINNTRVINGELNPASANDAVGDPSEVHSHLDSASLWAKLKHEKLWETLSTSSGLEYFDDRGWGDLVAGTPVHFPIPGKELETLGLQLYTFGASGVGAAEKRGLRPEGNSDPSLN